MDRLRIVRIGKSWEDDLFDVCAKAKMTTGMDYRDH